METRADPPPSDEPLAAPAAAYPRWILLERSGRWDGPDARTVAHARTSRGRPITVSLVLAAPPALSGLRLDSSGLPAGVSICARTIAAHGDSVLAEIQTSSDNDDDHDDDDYFLYCAGDAAAQPSRPPSLWLLPPCYLTKQNNPWRKQKRYMDHGITLLRRGRDEVLVAALDFCDSENRDDVLEAELCLLRSGNWQWELKRLPVIHEPAKKLEVACWVTDKVIPAGDRFLIWVDCLRGIIYSDVWQESPELRYVSLPVDPNPFKMNDRGESSYRSVCATDGGRTVRFVEVFRRCCCGCPGQTACPTSHNTFTIATWALRPDDMTTWDKVGVLDCAELWSLPGYQGVIPCTSPEYPIVSLDYSDVLYFMVHENEYHVGIDGDIGTWMIEFDTRLMELRSICYDESRFSFAQHFMASAISQYFDPSPRSDTVARRKDIDLEASAKPSKLTLPRVVACPEEMLATLREIPDLAREDIIKAYTVLAWDESQVKFRSLLTFPMHMRKNYCLSIGKLSCFDE